MCVLLGYSTQAHHSCNRLDSLTQGKRELLSQTCVKLSMELSPLQHSTAAPQAIHGPDCSSPAFRALWHSNPGLSNSQEKQCNLITDASTAFMLLWQLGRLVKCSVSFLIAIFLYISFVGVLC